MDNPNFKFQYFLDLKLRGYFNCTLILKSKFRIKNAYNPFLDDGSSLVSLYNHGEICNVYGKEKNSSDPFLKVYHL